MLLLLPAVWRYAMKKSFNGIPSDMSGETLHASYLAMTKSAKLMLFSPGRLAAGLNDSVSADKLRWLAHTQRETPRRRRRNLYVNAFQVGGFLFPLFHSKGVKVFSWELKKKSLARPNVPEGEAKLLQKASVMCCRVFERFL